MRDKTQIGELGTHSGISASMGKESATRERMVQLMYGHDVAVSKTADGLSKRTKLYDVWI